MCGCNNISGMKRRRKISGLGDAGSIAMSLLPTAAGFLLANVATKSLGAGAAQYSNLIKIGGGIVLASMTKGFIAQLGAGMALNGVTALGQGALTAAGMGLLPPGQQTYAIQGLNDFGSTRVIVQ